MTHPTVGLCTTLGIGTVVEMEPSPWRERVAAEEELVEQLREQMSQSAKRRADALRDGVAELGSMYAVAKELGRSETAVSRAIKKYQAAPAAPETTE